MRQTTRNSDISSPWPIQWFKPINSLLAWHRLSINDIEFLWCRISSDLISAQFHFKLIKKFEFIKKNWKIPCEFFCPTTIRLSFSSLAKWTQIEWISSKKKFHNLKRTTVFFSAHCKCVRCVIESTIHNEEWNICIAYFGIKKKSSRI